MSSPPPKRQRKKDTDIPTIKQESPQHKESPKPSIWLRDRPPTRHSIKDEEQMLSLLVNPSPFEEKFKCSDDTPLSQDMPLKNDIDLHSSPRNDGSTITKKQKSLNKSQADKQIKVEHNIDDLHDLKPSSSSPSSSSPSLTIDDESVSPTKPKRKRTPKAPKEANVPEHFYEQYNLIRQMRYSNQGVASKAAVDTMGCAALARPESPPKDQRFQTLVSLMLSAQTKDPITADAIDRLHTTLPGGLSVESILAADVDVVHECIRRVGFHNTKLKNLIKTAQILKEQYNGDIPSTIEGLLKLPGVGPKMGHLCMQSAFGKNTGIGVDTHVHRITNMLNWVNTKTPEQTREALESWLPKPMWQEINTLLVGIGQTVCPAKNPKCGSCLLAENLLCPKSTVKNEMRKKKMIQDTATTTTTTTGMDIVDNLSCSGVNSSDSKGKDKDKDIPTVKSEQITDNDDIEDIVMSKNTS